MSENQAVNFEFEFKKAQYLTLREEIKETKSRIFKLVGLGPSILPATKLIAEYSGTNLIYAFAPAFVVTIAMLYLSESHALMRCGRYIRKYIEPDFMANGKGWECWLESSDEDRLDTRATDRYVSCAFYVMSVFSYAFSVYLAKKYLLNWCIQQKWKLASAASWGAALIYSVAGLLIFWFFFKNTKHDTSTTWENPSLKA